MTITIHNTNKIVLLNGKQVRIWEGETESGIKIHCYMALIAHSKDEPPEAVRIFKYELKRVSAPSNEIEAIPLRLIL